MTLPGIIVPWAYAVAFMERRLTLAYYLVRQRANEAGIEAVVCQYNVVDVAPNLGRLLEFEREDRLTYFIGSEQQLDKLDENFGLYTGHFLNYVRMYEQQRFGV